VISRDLSRAVANRFPANGVNSGASRRFWCDLPVLPAYRREPGRRQTRQGVPGSVCRLCSDIAIGGRREATPWDSLISLSLAAPGVVYHVRASSRAKWPKL
jgi:hypothetical protein